MNYVSMYVVAAGAYGRMLDHSFIPDKPILVCHGLFLCVCSDVLIIDKIDYTLGMDIQIGTYFWHDL